MQVWVGIRLSINNLVRGTSLHKSLPRAFCLPREPTFFSCCVIICDIDITKPPHQSTTTVVLLAPILACGWLSWPGLGLKQVLILIESSGWLLALILFLVVGSSRNTSLGVRPVVHVLNCLLRFLLIPVARLVEQVLFLIESTGWLLVDFAVAIGVAPIRWDFQETRLRASGRWCKWWTVGYDFGLQLFRFAWSVETSPVSIDCFCVWWF